MNIAVLSQGLLSKIVGSHWALFFSVKARWKVILFPESGKFLLVESGIPLAIGICNPSSTVKKSVIQSLKSGIHSMESTIQDCFVSDSSPVVSLYLSLVVRGVWWEEGKRGRGTSFFFPFPSPHAPAARVSRRRLGTSQVLNYLTRGDLLVVNLGSCWIHIDHQK